jgi:hypothetical protein
MEPNALRTAHVRNINGPQPASEVSERQRLPFWPRLLAAVRSAWCYQGNLTRAWCLVRHCFAYIGPLNGPVQRPKPVRYFQYECYEASARYETRKLARVRPARCPTPWGPGEYGLKS